MTPDDVAQIRAFHEQGIDCNGDYCKGCQQAWPCDALALCDALEQTWDNCRAAYADLRDEADRDAERADRAEAVAMDHWKKALELTDALARVRALCDDIDVDEWWGCLCPTYKIRAAIEGDNQ